MSRQAMHTFQLGLVKCKMKASVLISDTKKVPETINSFAKRHGCSGRQALVQYTCLFSVMPSHRLAYMIFYSIVNNSTTLTHMLLLNG